MDEFKDFLEENKDYLNKSLEHNPTITPDDE